MENNSTPVIARAASACRETRAGRKQPEAISGDCAACSEPVLRLLRRPLGAPRNDRRGIPSRLLAMTLSLFFFLYFLNGCSSQAKDKLLRAFFDGVSSPKEEEAIVKQKEQIQVKVAGQEAALPPQTPVQFIHQPFLENQCDACHNPHNSANKFMLAEEVPKLCFNCHNEKDIKENPAHEGQDLCTECHNPHASSQKKLLK